MSEYIVREIGYPGQLKQEVVGELVRCRDCKNRDDDDFCTGRGYPNVLVPDDGFCDKGERMLTKQSKHGTGGRAMTKKEMIDLLNKLVELEERNDIGSLLRSERREFQYWVDEIIDAVPVAHGEWHEYDDDYGMLCCSVCEGRAPDAIRWDYCPHCGAKMVEGD